MLISGTPITADIPSDPAFKERFWYWTGASGRKYIHSVYGLDDCPPLPGAIYVAVRREGPMRIVVGIGQFSPHWEFLIGGCALQELREMGADEVHAHLLAKSPEVADAVFEDLLSAYDADDGEEQIFAEAPQRLLV
jgi:hypothetical protein